MRPIQRLFPVVALAALVLISLSGPAMAQEEGSPPPQEPRGQLAEVRPFQFWMEDTFVTPGFDLEPFVNFGDFNRGSVLELGVQGALWSLENMESGARLSFLSVDADNFTLPGGTVVDPGSESGISDLRLYTRYLIQQDNPDISVGGHLDLPVGSEDVGASTFDLTLFGAMRYRLETGTVILATAGIESVERDTGLGDDRSTGLVLGGGLLHSFTRKLSGVAELAFRTESENSAISTGLDYQVDSGGHLRGALLLGIDDGAPDLGLTLGFLLPLY